MRLSKVVFGLMLLFFTIDICGINDIDVGQSPPPKKGKKDSHFSYDDVFFITWLSLTVLGGALAGSYLPLEQ